MIIIRMISLAPISERYEKRIRQYYMDTTQVQDIGVITNNYWKDTRFVEKTIYISNGTDISRDEMRKQILSIFDGISLEEYDNTPVSYEFDYCICEEELLLGGVFLCVSLEL